MSGEESRRRWSPWARARAVALCLTVLAHGTLYAVRDLGIPSTPLQAAAAAGDESALASLLAASTTGFHDVRALLDPPTHSVYELLLHRNTALHYAAANGHTGCVKALLAAGMPPAASATLGPFGALLVAKPLFFAASGGHAGVCSALLDAGADPDDGLAIVRGIVATEAPLYAAAKGGHLGCARKLLEAGASPEVAGGYTSLLKVAEKHPNMVLLVQAYRKQAKAGFKNDDL